MAAPDDADEAVFEQRLRPHLRPRRLADDTRFQVDGSFAQRRAVLVGLRHEAQAYAGSLLQDTLQDPGAEILHEALAGAQRERPSQALEVELLGWAQRRLGLAHEL